MKRPAKELLLSPRALRIVIELLRSCTQDLADELGLYITVQCYTPEEGRPTNAEDVVTGHLIEYLESSGITAKVGQDYLQNLPESLPDNQFIIATTLYCKVLDRDKLAKLQEILSIAQSKNSVEINVAESTLTVGGQVIHFQPNSNMFELLRYTLKDRDAKRFGCAVSELSTELGIDQKLVRDTANNVNRRIRAATSGEVSVFLIVTTKDVKVRPDFI